MADPIDVTVSTFRGIGKRVRAVREYMWDELGPHLEDLLASEAEDKRALPGLVFAQVNGARSDETTEDLTALAIDIDALPDGRLKPFLRRCAALRCYVYETPSSREPFKGVRVRVVVAVRRRIPRGKTVAARLALARELGLDPRESGVAGAKAHSQVMFIGRLAGTEPRRFWAFGGKVWKAPRVEEAPERRAAARRSPGNQRADASRQWDPSSPPDLSVLLPELAPAGQDDDRHALVRAIGGYLARRGYAPAAIARAVAELPSDRPDERAGQARAAAEQVLDGLEAPGWRYLEDRFGAEVCAKLRADVADPREPEGWADVWHGDSDAASYEAMCKTFARFKPAVAALQDAAPGLDGLDVDEDGRPYGTVDNIARCLQHFLGHALVSDETTGRALLTETVRWSGARLEPDVLPAGPWRDFYTTLTQAHLNRLGMRGARKGDVQDAIALTAAHRPINVHGVWLRELAEQWDGEPRVDGAFAHYWRAADTAATRAASRVALLSTVARGLLPGEQVDTVPVLIGAQGCGKSQGLRALVGLRGADGKAVDPAELPYGAERRWCQSRIDMHSKDGSAVIRGYLIWELGELASMLRSEAEVVKDYLTRMSETFRPSHGREEETFKRTVSFWGSCNPDEAGLVVVNRDTTGGRRWLPVWVAPGYDDTKPETHKYGVRLAAIARDHKQLLGEAAARVLCGEAWHPTEDEKAAIAPLIAQVTDVNVEAEDPWKDAIRRWIAKRDKPFRVGAVFDPGSGAIPVDTARVGTKEVWRASRILRALGCVQGADEKKGGQVWRRSQHSL